MDSPMILKRISQICNILEKSPSQGLIMDLLENADLKHISSRRMAAIK